MKYLSSIEFAVRREKLDILKLVIPTVGPVLQEFGLGEAIVGRKSEICAWFLENGYTCDNDMASGKCHKVCVT